MANTYRTNGHTNMKGRTAHFLHRLTVKLVSEDLKINLLTTPISKTKTRARKVKGSLYDEGNARSNTNRIFFGM